MHIPEEVLKCVVFIGHGAGSNLYLDGTGFLIGIPFEDKPGTHFAYLVTAKHVIEKPYDNGAREFFLRANIKDKGAVWYPIGDGSNWIHHPVDDAADVIAMRVNISEDFDHLLIPNYMFTSEQTLKEDQTKLGDTVSIVGLFSQYHGEEKNLPIVRTGNLAVMNEQKVMTPYGKMDALLIEARSIGGISGSPVFLNPGSMRVIDGSLKIATNPRFHLFGLVHGHFNDDDDENLSPQEKARRAINTGIAIVTPIRKVIETITPDLEEQQKNAHSFK